MATKDAQRQLIAVSNVQEATIQDKKEVSMSSAEHEDQNPLPYPFCGAKMKTPSPSFLDFMTRCWAEYHGPNDGPTEIPAMPPAFLRGAMYALEYVKPEKIPERTFIIPYEIQSQNTLRGHWAKADKISRQTMISALSHNPGRKKEHRKMRMLLTCYRKKLITDIDNLIAGSKPFKDGIKRAGFLVDDSDKWLKVEYVQELSKKSPTGKPCTVVTLWPLEEK